MIKTILVPTSGTETDGKVFATALNIARKQGAHLDCLHIWISVAEAGMAPHADFVMGDAIGDAIRTLEARSDTRAMESQHRFHAFCEQEKIVVSQTPCGGVELSASLQIESDNAYARLLLRARHRDLIVVGRPHYTDGLPTDFAERLILEAGRPVLITADKAGPKAIDTVAVLWKESAEAARAVAAAMPILEKAKRVVLLGAEEGPTSGHDALKALAEELAWRGIVAEREVVRPRARSVPEMLFAAARSLKADLVVAGAYGHSRTRELFFGGVTSVALAQTEVPVLLTH